MLVIFSQDVLAIDDINVNLQPKYYPHPGGIDISMTLTAYGGAQFTYIGDAMMITVTMKTFLLVTKHKKISPIFV